MKKLTLKKESLVLLGESRVENIHAATTNWCWAIGSYITGKLVDKVIDALTEPGGGGVPYSQAATCTNNRLCWG